MHPLTPVSEQEREHVDSSTGGGWGALVVLVVLVAALTMAIIFFSGAGSGAEQTPVDPVPSESPVDPGY